MSPCTAAAAVVGGLSKPSKMPGLAFGLSAEHCITGSKLRMVPGSACSICYACKNLYVMPVVKRAHARRYQALQRALATPERRERWLQAMVRLLAKQRWFRWHDSGDLQSVAHLELIADVARATPHVAHWLPTHEPKMVRQYLAAGHVIPDNLNIRFSANMLNETIPAAGVSAGCTASAIWKNLDEAPGYRCPARTQDNECKDCRACWSRHVPLVTYPAH
jgi:hypothetical protein